VCGTAQTNLTHKHPVSKVGRAHKRGEEARKVLLWPWWRPQPPVPPPKATRHQPCPTERRVKAPDPQERTRPRTFRNAVLGHAARFRPAVNALLVADHLPNNIAARSGHLVHYLKDLGEGEGGYAQETDLPCERGSKSDPEVPNGHCPPRRSSRPPRRATEHAGGRTDHPTGSAGGHPVDSWRPVIRLPVSIHLVLSLTCRCAAHLMATKIP